MDRGGILSWKKVSAGDIMFFIFGSSEFPEIECNCPIYANFSQRFTWLEPTVTSTSSRPCSPEKIADPVRRGRDQQEQASHRLGAAKSKVPAALV